MNTFLQVVGAVALVGILLLLLMIVGGFFFVRAKFRKFTSDLKEMGERLGGSEWTALPARIHLKPKAKAEWQDAKAVEVAAAISGAGFTPVGAFQVPEFEGLEMQAFAWPEKSAYAVLYERAPVGLWVDAVFVGTDGTLTVSNAPHGEELDHPPGKEKLYLPGTEATEVIARCLQEAGGRGGMPVTADGFTSHFETAFAEEMDWRNSRGGVTEAEVRRNAAKNGQDVNEETIQLVLEAKKAHALSGLNVAFRERYLAASSLSAAEWEAQRERLVFVHDQLSAEYLSALLYGWQQDGHENEDEGDDGELPEVNLSGTTPRAAFSSYNDALPERHRGRKVAELQLPVPADVYVLPREFHLGD